MTGFPRGRILQEVAANLHRNALAFTIRRLHEELRFIRPLVSGIATFVNHPSSARWDPYPADGILIRSLFADVLVDPMPLRVDCRKLFDTAARVHRIEMVPELVADLDRQPLAPHGCQLHLAVRYPRPRGAGVGLASASSTRFSAVRCEPSGQGPGLVPPLLLLLDELRGGQGPQIVLGTITITFTEPQTLPSSLASIVVSPSSLSGCVARVPRIWKRIEPNDSFLVNCEMLIRLTPETAISKSLTRSFGLTSTLTQTNISLMHGSVELLLELQKLDELGEGGGAGIVKPILIGEGLKSAEQPELLDDGLLELLENQLLLDESNQRLDELVLDDELLGVPELLLLIVPPLELELCIA